MKGYELIGSVLLGLVGAVIAIAGSMSDSCAESTATSQACVGTGHDLVLMIVGIALGIAALAWFVVQLIRSSKANGP